jgi:hypothetical protein
MNKIITMIIAFIFISCANDPFVTKIKYSITGTTKKVYMEYIDSNGDIINGEFDTPISVCIDDTLRQFYCRAQSLDTNISSLSVKIHKDNKIVASKYDTGLYIDLKVDYDDVIDRDYY